jgi:DNA-binding transcriptional regulator LsrR (DeoR family)
MVVKRKFKSDLINVVNEDFVEQLWVKVIDSTQEIAKRYKFKEADIPSILNYLNDANWVEIFCTSDANTCVSLVYEKLERKFELFVPV